MIKGVHGVEPSKLASKSFQNHGFLLERNTTPGVSKFKMDSLSKSQSSDSKSHREDSPSWIPSSAQIPRPVDANVSPPRVLRKRKYATPDIPDEALPISKKLKSNSPKSKTHVYNGYKITLSPSQKRRRATPKPLKLPPLRGKDEREQFQHSTNIPNSNAAPIERSSIKFAANGIALPQKDTFDPWNVNSGGHQKADGKPATKERAWTVQRQAKLNSQFGGRRGQHDRELERGQMSIMDCWTKNSSSSITETSTIPSLVRKTSSKENINVKRVQKSDIFRDVVIHINGSTLPFISDHSLKHLIAENGGSTTISLARRSVTHVILTPKLTSTSSSQGNYVSAGGGLAAGKVEKEIMTMRGPSRNIKFVSPEWVTESVKARRRLPESRFAHWKMVSENQESVMDQFFVQGKPGVSSNEGKQE